jgi:hypothetical protein
MDPLANAEPASSGSYRIGVAIGEIARLSLEELKRLLAATLEHSQQE